MISALPSKAVPLIFLVAKSLVAVEALPVKAAVIVPAEKLPEASRKTMVEAVLIDEVATVPMAPAPSPYKSCPAENVICPVPPRLTGSVPTVLEKSILREEVATQAGSPPEMPRMPVVPIVPMLSLERVALFEA